jgi:hypothetical protein
MRTQPHIYIEGGPDQGRNIVVLPAGSRLGRSSKNDLTLSDPLLSRHHCRLFFKENDGLWVADLGSANETFVNGKAVMESRIRPGDKVTIGDTVMRVLDDAAEEGAAPQASGPIVDLGLQEGERPSSSAPLKLKKEWIVGIGVAVAAVATAAWIHIHYQKDQYPPDRTADPPRPTLPKTLEIAYEKVEGTTDNIFHYTLTIDRDGILTVQVVDLMNERRLREEKKIDAAKIAALIKEFNEHPFFTLKTEYAGFQPNVLALWDVSVTLDKKTHRTVVRNRPEPEEFKRIRERIEVFGKTELGLWAIQFPRERLIEMARDAYTRAQRLYDQRDVKFGNLHEAVVVLGRAQVDLRSVEPKPDFYPDSVTLLADCKKLLEERYTEYNFRASRAVNLGQWDNAARELRVILEMIPDESDSRYQQARSMLIEVENRQRHGR